MSGSAQTLLSHHPYIKLIANNGWIQEADFVILKARQAQTPFVGIASGDKGTERCFAYGLFPIIDWVWGKKFNFWDDFSKTLEALHESNHFGAIYKESLQSTIDYIRNTAQHPKMADQKAILQLNPACFALWKEKICPYVNEYYNIAKKIPLNVKIVMALGDLAQHPSSSSAIKCRKFLESLPEDIYEKLISCHKDFLQKTRFH